VVKQDTRSLLVVTSCAAGLLVIAFDRLRQGIMDDKPNVRLVDSHPERDGRTHDLAKREKRKKEKRKKDHVSIYPQV
jgi:hypothetical protein